MSVAIIRAKRILGLRLSALIEIGLFLLIAVIISFIFFDGSRFINVAPHPFWVIVLLIAIQYGTKEALFCVVSASVVLMIGNLPDTLLVNQYDYYLGVAYRPFLWVMVAIVIGEMRVKQLKERQQLRELITQERKEKQTISDAYEKLKTFKENVETRLASQMGSAISIYEVAKSLKSLKKEDIIAAVEDVVAAAIKPEKFSIYTLHKDKFYLTLFSGWNGSENYSRGFESDSPLYQEIVARKAPICAVRGEDEKLLAGEGVLAGALYDATTGKIFGMLKIEELEFAELNMRYIETFRILCEWIGMAYANAGKFEEIQEDSMIDYDHMLFSHNFFKRQNDFLTTLAIRLDFNLSMVSVRVGNAHELDDDEKLNSAIALAKAVESSLRKVDHVFNERRTEAEFAIILPGTHVEDTQIVVDKIKNELAKKQELIGKAWYSFSVQSLHVAKKINDKGKGKNHDTV